jgi:single-stranded DNA-binding protein
MVVENVVMVESKKDIFSYFDLEVWDKAADYVERNLRKGDTFIVNSGTPRQNRWEKDGVKHSKIIIRVKSFRVIPKKEPVNE